VIASCLLRDDGAPPAGASALGRRSPAGPDGHRHGQSHLVLHPESGHRAGYDGVKREKDSKLHAAIGSLGHLLACASRWSPSKTGRSRLACSSSLCRRPQVRAWNWPTWIRATPERTRRRPRLTHPARGGQAPGGEGSFVLLARRGVVERRCAGWHALGAWDTTLSGCSRPWPGCTSLPTLAFRYIGRSPHLARIHNTS
jgi:hypothetical protein